MEKHKLPNEQKVIEALCSNISQAASRAISEKNVFFIGLSGGSLVKYLSQGLPSIDTEWDKWRLFFCDERYVPESDADSTFGAYKKDLLAKVPIKESQFVTINTSLPLDECAKDYEKKILDAFEVKNGTIPEFDLLLLGMGPDGHTCSLFPGHLLLNEQQKLIAPIDDSPKPPSKRVTMTYPLINKAKCAIFALAGAAKADMVKRVFRDKEDLPAARVAPKVLKCIYDEEAGKYLD